MSLIFTFCAERTAALEKLKVYGRDVRDADPIFTRDVRKTLALSAVFKIDFAIINDDDNRESTLFQDMPFIVPQVLPPVKLYAVLPTHSSSNQRLGKYLSTLDLQTKLPRD
jgi:hypothetical protein